MSLKVTEFLEHELSLPDVNNLVKAQLIDVINFLELEFDGTKRIQELIVEAYKQKLRNYQKFGQQTCV